jgi:hypothetical protein
VAHARYELVLDPAHDRAQQLAALGQDRRVDRTPVAFLEHATLGSRAAEIVFLHSLRVRNDVAADAIQSAERLQLQLPVGL